VGEVGGCDGGELACHDRIETTWSKIRLIKLYFIRLAQEV